VSPSFFLHVRQRLFFGFFAGTGSSLSSSVPVEADAEACTVTSVEISLFDSSVSTATVLSDNVGSCWRSDLEVVLVLVLASLV